MSSRWTSESRQKTKKISPKIVNNYKNEFKKNNNFSLANQYERVQYLYGRKPILSYFGRGKIHKLYLQNGFSDKEILDQAKAYNVRIEYVSSDRLVDLAQGENHQGVLAVVDEYATCSLDELISSNKGKKRPVLVMLDEINDPHNVGAIIRNIDAFGIDGLIIKNRRQAQLTSTVYKVSTGALVFTKVAVVSNLVNAIKTLKENGYWIYSCSQEGAKPYNEVVFDTPTVIIFGNEGEGISRLVLENSDISITIPMYGHVESLNVASASAIILSRIKNK